MKQQKRTFHPLFILPILYVAVIYTFPLFLLLDACGVPWPEQMENTLTANALVWYLGALAACFALQVFVPLLAARRTDRVIFLKSAVIVKYSLIPLFLGCGAFFLIPLHPAQVLFVVCGWLIVAFTSPYIIIYLVKSYRQGIYTKIVAAVGCVLQFFFTADVVTVMLCALKEKTFKKWTFAAVIFTALFVMLLIGLLAAGVIALLGSAIFDAIKQTTAPMAFDM